MGKFRIVEAVDVAPERSAGFRYTVIGAQIDLLIFDGAPEPFDDDIVPPSRLAIHVDGDLVFQEEAHEVHARKLTVLIGIEDLWLAITLEPLGPPQDKNRSRA